MGTPNREHQEYSTTVIECKDSGRYIPFVIPLYSRGPLFGVPRKVPAGFERMGLRQLGLYNNPKPSAG